MFKTIKTVKPLEDFILQVHFESGEIKNYDVKKLFEKHSEFKTLININGLFEQVHVDTGGYGICFNDELDLSSDELYYNSASEGLCPYGE